MTLLLTLATLATTAAPLHPCHPTVSDRIDDVERYLERCELFGWSGAALVVTGGRVRLNRGFGLADAHAGVPIGPETVFEIASITKPITAAAILALAEDERLDLDASIAEYLPGVPDDKRAITVRHLLAHTSGMPRSAAGGYGDDLSNAVSGFLGGDLAREPGAKHEYWNGGYALLAGIVEEVSGEGYVKFCRSRLFDPVKARATGFTGESIWREGREAVGYSAGAPVRPASGHPYGDSYGYQYRGMGGVVTTAEELWKITDAILSGKLLERDTVEEMLTVADGSYGLGFARTQTRRGTTRIGHGGDVRGFHAQLQVFPDEDAAIVLLSNVDEVPMWHLAWNAEALLFGGEPPYPMPPEILELKERELTRLAGAYETEDGDRITVDVRGAGLVLAAEGLGAGALLTGHTLGPSVQGTLDSMVELIEAVAEGDPEPAQRILEERIPSSWPRRLVEEIFPAHEKEWGALEDVTAVSGKELSPGRVEGVFELRHAKGRAHARVIYTGGRLSIFDLKATKPETAARFAPTNERDGTPSFDTFRWSPDPRAKTATPKLEFELERRKVEAMRLTLMSGVVVRLARER